MKIPFQSVTAAISFTLFFASILPGQPPSFLPALKNPLSDASTRFFTGDFNRDGKQDLLLSDNSGNPSILLGQGDGTFQPKVSLNPGGAAIYVVVVADVNRDGKLDLVVRTSLPNFNGASLPDSTGILLGVGDGTFLPMQKVADNVTPHLIADFNGDGIPDLLVGFELSSQRFECQFEVRLGNGDGTFRADVGCVPSGDQGSRDLFCVGDFNGDGKLDVVWTSDNRGYTYLWLGNGDGTFQREQYLGYGVGSGLKSVIAADFNRDGKLDLLLVGGVGVIRVFSGNGDGTFRSGENLAGKFWSLEFRRDAVVADLNADGILDIACDNLFLLGNGDGTFQPAQHLFDAPVMSHAVAAADFNGDGKADLIFLDLNANDKVATSSLFLSKSPVSPAHEQVAYSAANGANFLAPGSIASIFAKNPATTVARATTDVLPTNLGGVSLQIRDSTGAVQLAPLYFVSPTQINFLVPETIPIGFVTLTVDNSTLPLGEGANATRINDISPAFFTMNPQGTPAATALRIHADGKRESVPVFTCGSAGQCASVPIDLSTGDAFYLSLYGTGLRHRQEPYPGDPAPQGACKVGGIDVAVQYSGAQGTLPGMDQVNLLLPKFLPSGIATVSCRFRGQFAYYDYSGPDSYLGWPSNPVQIVIK